MKPLSVSQQLHVENIMTTTEQLRKRVTLYKKNDPSMALFRVQLLNNIQDAVIAKATNKQRTKKLENYIKGWENDAGIGKDIVALFEAIETA